MQFNRSRQRDAAIAVIGAGVSGVTAVYVIMKKGYRIITLFEQISGGCSGPHIR